MKWHEARFVGSGNVWVANGTYRGWQVACRQCGVTKTITGRHRDSLPPNIILKKLVQAGWYIGNKPEDDVCGGCRRKAARKANGHAPAPAVERKAETKPWTDAAGYFAQLHACLSIAKTAAKAGQKNKLASCIDEALQRLDPAVTATVLALAIEQATPPKPDVATQPGSFKEAVHEVIDAMLENQPATRRRAPPKRKPEPERRPAESDEEYARWLDEVKAD
jgi:hypothetical protein